LAPVKQQLILPFNGKGKAILELIIYLVINAKK